MLKRWLKEAPIHEWLELQNILNDIQKRYWWSPELKIRENIERNSVRLGDNSTQIIMLSQKKTKLFVESKSGKLDEPKEELENHLRMTYSEDWNCTPISPLRDLPKPEDPTLMFSDSRIKLSEVQDFVHKACAGSAPGMNGILYKLYKNCPRIHSKLTDLLQQVWKKCIVPQEWYLADGILIPKEMQSRGITNFRPISLMNVEGKYFLEFLLAVWQPF